MGRPDGLIQNTDFTARREIAGPGRPARHPRFDSLTAKFASRASATCARNVRSTLVRLSLKQAGVAHGREHVLDARVFEQALAGAQAPCVRHIDRALQIGSFSSDIHGHPIAISIGELVVEEVFHAPVFGSRAENFTAAS